MIKPYYQDDWVTIYNRDCLEIIEEIILVDLILTDPPYNAKNIGPNKREYDITPMQLPEKEYKKFCNDWFELSKEVSNRIVFTPGIVNTHNYPQPDWILCWHKPSAVCFSRLGSFNVWEPIFVYGKAKKRIGQDFIKYDSLNFSKGPEKYHPCPKNIHLIKWLIDKFSKINDIVLDPFLGSGTTARACKDLQRHCIGIEKSQAYCDIAVDRLSQEVLNFGGVGND